MITKQTQLSNADLIHRQSVRKAYDTAEGRQELLRLLADLGNFREISESELPLRNYGIRKLEELGFLDVEVVEAVIHFLFNLPLALRPTIEEMGELKDDLL